MTTTNFPMAGWDVLAERDRQVNVEGFSLDQDDRQEKGELALAAALYATPTPLFSVVALKGAVVWNDPWPWWRISQEGVAHVVKIADGRERHDQRRRLVIAGALILAEIERLDRLAGVVPPQPEAGAATSTERTARSEGAA